MQAGSLTHIYYNLECNTRLYEKQEIAWVSESGHKNHTKFQIPALGNNFYVISSLTSKTNLFILEFLYTQSCFSLTWCQSMK